MKRLVSAFSFLFIVVNAMGQYGHEWIAYDQPYAKIGVAETGVYRITFQDLQAAGLSGVGDPRTFQLFHRGKEQAIRVSGESDGQFNTTDYIEFYGRRNDGTLDNSLYENATHQPHAFYNLFSDTTGYFLTFGSTTGKRMSSPTMPSTGLVEETHHWNENLLILKENYSSGVYYGDVQQTFFDQGEGWMGTQILHGQESSYTFSGVAEFAAAQGKPAVEILLTGRGPMVHNVALYAGQRLLSTVSFTGYQSYKHAQSLEWPDIGTDGTLTIRVRVTGAAGADRVSAGYIRLLFPQRFTLSDIPQKVFHLPANPANVSFIKIENPLAGTRLFDITDPDDVRLIPSVMSGTLDAVISSTAIPRSILATDKTLAPSLQHISFREINPAVHNYIIITHPSLRRPAMGYTDPVKAYAEYRSLPEGGGHDTLIVNIDQLYNQFNFGERSPRAILQFMKFLASVNMPDHLFLIGKGLSVNYGYGRNPGAFTTYRDLVPTAGYPASDMAFTTGLSGVPYVPAVATGRLAAVHSGQVAAYLNKVKETEALTFDDLSRKNILHLSGGIEDHEPLWFSQILKGFESVAQDLYLGGNVQAISKQSTNVKVINIADEVNKGLGLITFFGHSAPNTLDFDIGRVTDPVMGYNNRGKYPVLLMNGCDAGSFFLNTSILGENWVNTADKGAIGFIAHSALGLVSALERYSSLFYEVAYGDSVFIHSGIGAVQKEAGRRYLEKFGPSPLAISQVQQMVLLGDPALKIFGATKPDYEIDETNIQVSSFNGEPVSALADSFRIQIPIRNFGIAEGGNIRIHISREIDDHTHIPYDTVIRAVLYSDTVVMVIRNPDNKGFGNNVFHIEIEADHRTDELSEINNTASYEYFIPLHGTKHVYPHDYGIVKTREVNLTFQHTDLLSPQRVYFIEIDTAHTFDSGYRKQFQVSAEVLGKQAVSLLEADSLVYYWRTKMAQPLEHESKAWVVSSFTYIDDGPEGWAQIRFPQFAANETSGLVRDPQVNKIRFRETVSDIAVKTFSAASGKPRDSVSFKINGAEFNLMHEGGACRDNTINMIAFDRKSTQPYPGLDFKWYEILYEYGGRALICGREPYVINSFKPSELVTGNGDDLIRYIDNIHSGDSVVLFSIGDAGYEQWPDAAKIKLAELGISSAQLTPLQDGDPVVIFGRKNAVAGSAEIFQAASPELPVQVNETISGRYTSGSMRSVIIGPAQRWEQLIIKTLEAEEEDIFSFDIIGITAEGTHDTLRANLVATEDITSISAAAYPHLQLIFNTADDINLTAVQVARWIVVYEPVAEGILIYRGPADQQELFEGQILYGDFGFVNISDKSFADSLAVRFNVLNHARPGAEPAFINIKGPGTGDTTLFTIPFSTLSKQGLNDIKVFVNPHVVQEKFYDNNVMVLGDHLTVLGDNQNPVVDVTFDGRYLAQGEFVSPHPAILIRLWDENSFMQKKDTVGMNFFMKFPCASDVCGFKRINFSQPDVSWQPATASSEFSIQYSPQDLSDGLYTLRVEASDASENPSGAAPYEINFQVKREPSLWVSSPYPNPFYFQTHIDIVLTGATAEDQSYRLQITTLGGRVVQEFSGTAGAFHVGKNTLVWNGFDRHTQSQPNGIYLYRLLISNRDHVRTFHGKIVLLR